MLPWRIIVALVFVLALSVSFQFQPRATLLNNGCCTTDGTLTSNGVVPATWNSSDKSANITLSGANLIATGACGGSWCTVRSATSHSTGKWYVVMTLTTLSVGTMMGVADASATLANFCGFDTHGAGFQQQREFWTNSAGQINMLTATMVATDKLTLAIDLDNHKIWAKVNQTNTNGTWSQSGGGGTPAAGTSSLPITTETPPLYLCGSMNTTDAITLNPTTTDSDTGLVGFSVW